MRLSSLQHQDFMLARSRQLVNDNAPSRPGADDNIIRLEIPKSSHLKATEPRRRSPLPHRAQCCGFGPFAVQMAARR